MRDRISPGTLVFAAAAVVLALPCLVFRYLPMTDLPQHQAVLSILLHLDDPAWGFSAFYERDLAASPYLLPYGLAALLHLAMPLGDAMRAVASLSVIAAPLGVFAALRALRRPAWPALLALALAYDRAFFFGFVNLKLGIGFGLLAIAAALADPQTARARVAGAAATLAAAFTHPYGLALPVAFLAVQAAAGGGLRALASRWAVWVPAVATGVAWAFAGSAAQGYDEPIDPPLLDRVLDFPAQVLGGYRDPTEAALLLVIAAGIALGAARFRWRAATPADRALVLLAVANLALYALLPQATGTAKFVHFRHAALALLLVLPVLEAGRPARIAAVACAVFAAANAWLHLWAFDAEARGFDAVRAAIPAGARVASLAIDRDGEVMRTAPYLHFAAYAQADAGGLPAVTFPRLFWNLPVRFREDAGVPPTPVRFEWNPRLYSHKEFGHFYDHVLVRRPGPAVLGTAPDFPCEPALVAPPWQLYRAIRGVAPRHGADRSYRRAARGGS
ncbi:MAG: hypothetical protein FJ087_05815 [Deltaproteobacteria bacterium]|nr:hypothetical protein [Deltaproteobacteria bacterium]